MFKKTILATATAGLIALGGLGATTSTASAANATVQFGGPGWNLQFGTNGPGPQHNFHPQRFCQPVIKKVKWWDRYGRPHVTPVVVGEKCPPRHFQGRGPGYGNGGYGPGGFGGPGRGPGWGGW